MSRRLSVETMEGRLMLSATTIELAPLDLRSAHLTLAVGQLSTGDQTISMTMPSEGGFITNLSTPGSQFDEIFGTPVVVDANLFTSDLLARSQLSTNGLTDSMQVAGSAYYGNGLHPVVIIFSDNGGGLQPVIKGLIVGPVDNHPGAGEGGSIPIHPLLAGLRNDERLASDQKPPGLGPAEKLAKSNPATRSATTSSNSALAGEWGRGMIFEIAGGEPGAASETALKEVSGQTSAGEATTQGDEPLSTNGLQINGANVTGREHDAAQPMDQTGNIVVLEQSANDPTLRTAEIADRVSSADANPSLTGIEPIDCSSPSQLTAAQQGAGAATLGKCESGLPAIASAVAFEQFGEGEAAYGEPSASGNWWERTLGAAPLLLVLALERIAAHNSRRPTRGALIEVAQKPLRPRMLRGILPD